MVIISGVRFAGKVDAVPKVGHVATRFFHLYYVPLIPVGTFLVTDERDDEFSGLPLPWSFKSIIVGWLRTAAFVAFAPAIFLLVTGVNRGDAERVGAGLAIMLVAAVVLWFCYRLKSITNASYERAMELASRLGLSPEQRLLLEVSYGRMTAEQAEKELIRVYEAAGQPVMGGNSSV
jgi:hypothetical protein